MDPNILLESFSPDDMEIWQSYNLFTDENINSYSNKDQIKENTDIMDNIFTSIYPNDLMNLCHYQPEQQQPQQQQQIQYDYIRKEYTSEEYYSSSSSTSVIDLKRHHMDSSSSSSSLSSKSFNLNKSLKNKQNNHQNNLNNSNCNSDDDCWPFLFSLSKLPSTGPILLTEEEKRTLVQEGHQVPSQLPLSKGEEKILKKIRRKIKNKISAQESRRKKKEYVDSLEKRMETYINQNFKLRKRLEDIEMNNKNLCSTSVVIDQLGILIMIIVLFCAVVLGVWSPSPNAKTQSASSTQSQLTSTSSPSSCGKIVSTTRFRLVNSGSIANVVNTYKNIHQRNSSSGTNVIPSIIKLN